MSYVCLRHFFIFYKRHFHCFYFHLTSLLLYNVMINQTETFELYQTTHKYQTKKRSTHLQAFTQIFKSIKKKNQISQFLSNAYRNNIYSPPIVFNPKQKTIPFLSIEGWTINRTFENTVLLLDILLTLANFIISSFEAFLPDYQSFKQESSSLLFLNILSILTFTITIILSLTIKDIQNGVKYIYLIDIAKKEIFKGGFFVQISLLITLILTTGDNYEQEYIQGVQVAYFVLCICKIYILNFKMNKMELLLINTLKKQRYWNLVKVLMFNLFFAHFIASIFLALLKMDSEKNWYQTKNGINAHPNWLELYTWAYYWACTTMITIGFGDFSPAIAEQAIIVSALQILSSIVIAYNISQIGSIILSINMKNHTINSKIGLLRRMNIENQVSPELNHVIEEYLVHQLAILEEFQYSKHRELISSLPQQLQKKYYLQSQRNIFRKLPFFMNISSEALVQFHLQLTGKVYYPGEFIIQLAFAQEINIALKGQLGYCYRKSGSSINQAVIQTVYVDYSKDKPILLAKNVLNKNEGIYFDIKATKYSYGIKFAYQTFINILKVNEIDYHYYLMTLDVHQAQSSLAVRQCEYCSYGYHTKFQCPRLHFMPLGSIVIARENEVSASSQNQLRKFSFSQFRREKTPHCYYLRSHFNSQEFKQLEKDHYKDAHFTQLRSAVRSFGSKKNIQQVYNKSVARLLRNKRKCEENSHFEMDDVDKPEDFRHYFTNMNPEKLLNTSLSKVEKQIKEALVSFFF